MTVFKRYVLDKWMDHIVSVSNNIVPLPKNTSSFDMANVLQISWMSGGGRGYL